MRDRATIDVRQAGSPRLTGHEWLAVGLGSGLLGGIALALPIVLWDWARAGHQAFELPMAATSWLFGLQHFSHVEYFGWSLVIGIVLLAAYAALSGLVFTGLTDRVFGIAGPVGSAGAGIAWAFVSFLFFWYMLLPIARDGAPFRAARGAAELFVAPNWVWILGFALLGLVTGACYAALHPSQTGGEMYDEGGITGSPLRRAA